MVEKRIVHAYLYKNADFVCRMEDILDVYKRPYNSR